MVKLVESAPGDDRSELDVSEGEAKPLRGVSPWRPVIEEIGRVVDGRRDQVATIGSINWLRHAMDLAGANSNVVRNIIYRDKGRLHDKRALYLILVDLRQQLGLSPIEDPALTLLASPFAAAELEVSQVLGREQRRVYRSFVGGTRAGTFPKILVTGKPGAGKTMLLDYVQQGLEIEPRAADEVARSDFTDSDVTAGLVRLATQLGAPAGLIESRLVRIGAASSFAVQADSQAEVVRVILETQRHRQGNLAVLVHMSRALTAEGTLGAVPLRLNTPEVPRVSAADWLWFTLLKPLALTANVSVFVSTSSLPAKAVESSLPFEGPVTLAQPTTGEARRYVRSLATQLDAATCDDIVRRAGRSYEELRTLTLLAQAKWTRSDGTPDGKAEGSPGGGAEGESEAGSGGDADEARAIGARALEELAAMVETTAEPTLRAFLAALAVLSAGDRPGFTSDQLVALRGGRRKTLNELELSFLDQVPGSDQQYRPFSRRLARALHERLTATQPRHAKALHLAAAQQHADAALADPGGEQAGAYLFHLFAARSWTDLLDWMSNGMVPFPLLTRLWTVARIELGGEAASHADRTLLERLALELARHLLRLGADQHVELLRAFELLAGSDATENQAWAAVLRAQLEVVAGRFERASVLLDVSPPVDEPLLVAEHRLTRAAVLRWRGELEAASDIVARVGEDAAVRSVLPTLATRAVLAKTAVWSGLIAKDRGDLGAAMTALSVDIDSDELLRARLAFQRGDVLLRLGLFDGAAFELDNAISAAGSSGALAQERARYLARRGTMRRQMGNVSGSREDFAAAQAALESSELTDLDLDFALAKVADEGSYTLLADGDFEEAIVANTTALATFRAYQTKRDVDAGFRMTRSSLRLAVAYAFRGFALPFRRPLPAFRLEGSGPDLRHAVAAIDGLIADLERPGTKVVASTSAVDGLLEEARVLAALVAPEGSHALRHADAALEAAQYHYHRARAQTARAGALLKLGRPADALAAIAAGEDELQASRHPAWLPSGSKRPAPDNGDLSLVAQFAVFRAAVQLSAGEQNEAAEAVWLALDDDRLAPFHEAALRAFGEAAEVLGRDGAWKRHRHLRTLLGVNGTGPSTPARLPDALVAAWRSRTAAA